MKVLVTGASGFVGGALVRRLRDDQANIVIETARSRDGLALSADTDWAEPLNGAACVIHAAARVHVMQEKAADPLAEFRLVNVDGTLALAQQAAQAGVRRFVFLSSIKVNGEATADGHAFTEADVPAPLDPYGISKHEAEGALRQVATETGMEVVIVRLPLVYGPGVKGNFATLMRAVHQGWPLPLGAVNNRRSLVGLDNLVDFLALCTTRAEAANQTFLVSDGHDLSTTDLIRQMAQAAGRPARLVPVPAAALLAAATLVNKRPAVQRLYGNLQVDIAKAQRMLSWVPPVTVAEGLRRAAAGGA